MSHMWETNEMAVSPDKFLQAVWKLMPSFHGYQQQDAQEFIRYLLDTMHTELTTFKGKTVIMQLFQGTLVNKV
jgi:ubiquitin C-terminal hydrolase